MLRKQLRFWSWISLNFRVYSHNEQWKKYTKLELESETEALYRIAPEEVALGMVVFKSGIDLYTRKRRVRLSNICCLLVYSGSAHMWGDIICINCSKTNNQNNLRQRVFVAADTSCDTVGIPTSSFERSPPQTALAEDFKYNSDGRWTANMTENGGSGFTQLK